MNDAVRWPPRGDERAITRRDTFDAEVGFPLIDTARAVEMRERRAQRRQPYEHDQAFWESAS